MDISTHHMCTRLWTVVISVFESLNMKNSSKSFVGGRNIDAKLHAVNCLVIFAKNACSVFFPEKSFDANY